MSESWLLLETSGRGGRVGLTVGGQLARSASLDSARRHNRDLAPTVAAMLPRDRLTGVMVSVGPGSYTGLRVGVMSAKALAYATGCRLVAVPTFHIIAEQTPPEATSVEVIADALQGLVYAQRFHRADYEWRPANELHIEAATDWVTQLGDNSWVSGPGVALVEQLLPHGTVRVEVERRTPDLEAMLRAGLRLPALPLAEVMRLEPLYLRGSSAEEKQKASGDEAPARPR